MNFLLDTATTQNQGSIWPTIIMIAVMVLFFYFFMIRPQKKQEKKDAEMRDSLAVGDEVTTIGGIIGKVVSIKGETFVLETTRDKTKIRFLKGAIRSVDVKAADIAAAVIAEKNEANKDESGADDNAAPELKADEPQENKPNKKKDKKAKKNNGVDVTDTAETTSDEAQESITEENK